MSVAAGAAAAPNGAAAGGLSAVRGTATAAAIAKGALRRLAQDQREPTPEHYAAAYADEAASLGIAVAVARTGAAPPADGAAAATPVVAATPAGSSTAEAAGAGARTDGAAWPVLVDRLVRQLDRGGRQWTAARRKDSVQRVLAGSAGDAQRLQQRLSSLMTAWETDAPAGPALAAPDHAPPDAVAASTAAMGPPTAHAATVSIAAPAATPRGATPLGSAPGPASLAPSGSTTSTAVAASAPAADGGVGAHWPLAVELLDDALRAGLAAGPAAALELADRLSERGRGLRARGAPAADVEALRHDCSEARVLFGQQHRVVGELAALCLALTDGMAELAEDGSWTRGQCEAVRACLRGDGEADEEGRAEDPPAPSTSGGAGGSASVSPSSPSAASSAASGAAPARTAGDAQRRRSPRVPSERALRAASARLAQARRHHGRVRQQRDAARDALKVLLQDMLHDVVELDTQTGQFHAATAAHADAIARADSLDGLAGVVRSMLADSHAVRDAVGRSRERLQGGHAHARTLEGRVRELEHELRRLSDEASTDALTQLANRRGLARAFEVESRRAVDAGAPALAVGLIDIDNFKRLNDTLGHAAGDVALQRLAHEVRERLRPGDHLARFGGEEFVVLLPDTPLRDAEQALTRLQRSLTEALFLHDGREVFVTFSAGVTAWRGGEPMDSALERADRALYEAKRSGKNRTCSA